MYFESFLALALFTFDVTNDGTELQFNSTVYNDNCGCSLELSW